MDNLEDNQGKKQSEEKEPSVAKQVDREFEYAEDRGEPVQEQIENELSEPKYILPSPDKSQADVDFYNITADQEGLAFGVANQRNEPLDVTEKVEERDEDRWELDPASASEDYKNE